MNAHPTPMQPAPLADARMLKMLQLKSQMEELHAQLEYLRLMLKLGASQR